MVIIASIFFQYGDYRFLIKLSFLCIYLCLLTGPKTGSSPIFNIASGTPAAAVRKTGADDFLNSENDKNDYDW